MRIKFILLWKFSKSENSKVIVSIVRLIIDDRETESEFSPRFLFLFKQMIFLREAW